MGRVSGRRLAAGAGGLATIHGCIIKKPPVAPRSSVVRYATRQIELGDGLRVVLETAPDFGTAAAVLMVDAGSADEPAGKAGLAHLTEHVVFEGLHGGVSLAERQRDVGSAVTATTGWDGTTYYAGDAVDALDQLVTFMNGVLTEPMAGVDQTTFERELRAVANERRTRTEEGTPGQAIGWLMAAAFP